MSQDAQRRPGNFGRGGRPPRIHSGMTGELELELEILVVVSDELP